MGINSNYKNFKEKDDSPFYAAYLNTAKQNIFIVLRDISERLGCEFDKKSDDNMLKNSSQIWIKLQQNDKAEDTRKIIESLKRHFTFLEPLALNYVHNRTNGVEKEASPEDYHDALKLWIQQLLDYRNFYTHAVHTPVIINSAITDGMRLLYDADGKDFKKRYSLTEEQVEHLVRLGKNGERKNFHYGFTNTEGLTEKGFLYFVCLWLEKKDAQELLKKHEGFKRGETKSEKATLEKFTWFRTIIPKPRLTSDTSTQGLFLDMVNELKRCPKELYVLLSKEDRRNFIPKDFIDEDYSTEEYETVPVLTRHNNRFYSFAMRYLEQSFNHLKFHIDLGNYCFESYEQIIDDVPRKRRWIKRMTAFGNLTDFNEHNRPQAWDEKLEKVEERGKLDTYITETTPHYHVDPDSEVKVIGMKWIESYNPQQVWPDIEEETVKPKNESPDYWLSLYELPAMVFYQLLHQNGVAKDSAERVVQIHRGRIIGFLINVEKGKVTKGFTKEELSTELEKKGLHISDIPKAVINYLLVKDCKSLEEKVKNRLKEWKEENDRMLSSVQRQEKHFNRKPGSKDYIRMKSGHMADFLARDMIRLQKPINEDQGKPNSTEFQVLQGKLAFFGKFKETLSATFKLCNLIDSVNPHPFLHKIELQKCNGILDFYTCYLQLRQGYLLQCLQEKNFTQYHFLKLRNGDQEISKLIAKQRESVMNLPRGLFKQPILQALKSDDQYRELAMQLENKERINVTYIIQAYFKQIRKDSSQEFYGFKRSYVLLNKLYDNRRAKDKTPVRKLYFTTSQLEDKAEETKQKLTQKVEQQIQKKKTILPEDIARIKGNYHKQYKHFAETEKQIRLFQNCDKILFMVIDQMYRKGDFLFDRDKKGKEKKELSLGDKYKLSEIKPDAERSILSEQVPVKIKVYYPEKEKTHYKTIVHDSLKIKNYGDFRAFLKDRRVNSMLPYIPAHELPYEAIKRELEEFSLARISVFEKILAFENGVKTKFLLTKNEWGFIDHKSFLACVGGLSDDRAKKMNELRNMVCHSLYPDYNLFKYLINGNDFHRLAEYRTENEEIRSKSIIFQLKKMAINYYTEALALI